MHPRTGRTPRTEGGPTEMPTSPAAILRAAQSAGITIELAGDKIRLSGNDQAIERFRPVVVANRSSIVETLRQQPAAGGAGGRGVGGISAIASTASGRIFDLAARDCPDEKSVIVLHDSRGRAYKAVPAKEYAEVVSALRSEG